MVLHIKLVLNQKEINNQKNKLEENQDQQIKELNQLSEHIHQMLIGKQQQRAEVKRQEQRNLVI